MFIKMHISWCQELNREIFYKRLLIELKKDPHAYAADGTEKETDVAQRHSPIMDDLRYLLDLTKLRYIQLTYEEVPGTRQSNTKEQFCISICRKCTRFGENNTIGNELMYLVGDSKLLLDYLAMVWAFFLRAVSSFPLQSTLPNLTSHVYIYTFEMLPFSNPFNIDVSHTWNHGLFTFKRMGIPRNVLVHLMKKT